MGVGLGVSRNSQAVTCESASVSCESVADQFDLGRRTDVATDVMGIAGIAARWREHIVVRGAVHVHSPRGNYAPLTELGVTLGYRF